jgi:histidine triad (HIT) family protein
VWEGDRFIAFLDAHPVNPGHLLIIPKEHIENIFDMPDGLYKEIFKTAKALSTPLQKAMRSVRIGIIVEGFGVPHVHLHLVPINHGHDMDSGRAMTMSENEMKKVVNKIKTEIEIEKINSSK